MKMNLILNKSALQEKFANLLFSDVTFWHFQEEVRTIMLHIAEADPEAEIILRNNDGFHYKITVPTGIPKTQKHLKDWLPFDYTRGNVDERIYGHTNDLVIREIDGRDDPWPGKHKNVLNWCILETGYAVGWNESPSKGWTFLIKKIKITFNITVFNDGRISQTKKNYDK